MINSLTDLLAFTEFLYAFQQVERDIAHPGTTLMENDMEHSFQLALVAWFLLDQEKSSLDRSLVFQYALSHDLVETYAGDTLFDADAAARAAKRVREQAALRTIQAQFPTFASLTDRIAAYETQSDPESRFVYALDKLLPMVNVYLDHGRWWQERRYTLARLLTFKVGKADAHPLVTKYYTAFCRLLARHETYYFQGKGPQGSETGPAYLLRFISFIRFTHTFRQIERAAHVPFRERHENDAEHSYQLALAAWFLVATNQLPLKLDTILDYAISHDLVEAYTGDIPFFNITSPQAKKATEHSAALQFQHEFPGCPQLHAKIEAYESRNDPESRFVYALDKLLPTINNYRSHGQAWKEAKVTRNQVVSYVEPKITLSPEILPYFHQLEPLLTSDYF